MLTYILFILGFYVLIKGADLLVDGAVAIAQKMKISSIVIGLTIVAFGTSAPELVVNILSSIKGTSEIAIGNILGSNIVNILLILGVSAMFYPLTTKKNTVWKEIPFSLLAAVLLGVLVNDRLIDGYNLSELSRTDGIIFLSFFIIFIYYTFGIAKIREKMDDEVEVVNMSYLKSAVFIFLGIIGLVLGGKWIVEGAVEIAEYFHVSQSLIGLTIVAIGTSLPELATSIVAAYKKHADIAVGNVVGSNIFNIFFVLGISAIIKPLPFNAVFDFDIMITILASLILFFIMFVGKKHTITKNEGFIMVSLYIFYIAFLVGKQ
ncbi:MAG: calcium/sodium antiporter [Candidatus Moranbacteria bacterium]|jgi:cation:H+ antiporter|nr:calcium/sodium antiporter [Candidatus Moranbacteria bacterium]